MVRSIVFNTNGKSSEELMIFVYSNSGVASEDQARTICGRGLVFMPALP